MTTTVRNIMTKKLETIEDSASVQDAAKKMKDKGVKLHTEKIFLDMDETTYR